MRFWFPVMIKYSLLIYFWNFLHTVALVSIHLSVKTVPWSKALVPLETEQTIWWPYDELHGFRFFLGLFRIQSMIDYLSHWNCIFLKEPFLLREWNIIIITRTTDSPIIKRGNVPHPESNFAQPYFDIFKQGKMTWCIDFSNHDIKMALPCWPTFNFFKFSISSKIFWD